MAKATFTFDLDDPDDREAHLRHTKSLGMASALWEIRREFRAKLKHCDADSITLSKALEIVVENMADNDIDLDHLIS